VSDSQSHIEGVDASLGAITDTTRFVDLDSNPNIAALTKVLREVSSVRDPAEMLKAFGPWVGQRFPRDAFISVSIRDLPEGSYKITRSMSQGETNPRSSPAGGDPWKNWNLLTTYKGGLIGEIVATGEPQVVTGFDLTKDEAILEALGPYASQLNSMTAMPTFDNGEPLNWALSFHEKMDWENLDTFVLGLVDMNMMGSATRNLVYRKQAETLNEQLVGQFEQIAKIQQQLLPQRDPEFEGYKLATSYLTSNIAGGDYYDYIQGTDGRVGIIIADVSGHGPGAATVMAMLRAILHCYSETLESSDLVTGDTADVANFCNRNLVAANLNGEFATAFFCVIDPKNGHLQWTRCGHNPPMIRKPDGRIITLETAATLPLGIVDGIDFESDSCTMEPGDTLILYTDGITEASAHPHHSANDELVMFGVDRLEAAVESCSGDPSCAIDSIHTALHQFTHRLGREDDQTLVVVQRNAVSSQSEDSASEHGE
jgi:phosphoserine phosphatase RsbU/P